MFSSSFLSPTLEVNKLYHRFHGNNILIELEIKGSPAQMWQPKSREFSVRLQTTLLTLLQKSLLVLNHPKPILDDWIPYGKGGINCFFVYYDANFHFDSS